MDLKTNFLNKDFTNPIVLASGILGVSTAGMANTVKNGCGGVTLKTLFKEKRPGHPNPTMFGTEHYFINAVGLSGSGIENATEEIRKFKELSDAPLIGSIGAGSTDEFVEATKLINQTPIDFLEINISCPNVGTEFGVPFAYSPKAVETITSRIKKVSRVPISIKLAPGVWNISEIAKAAESAGADAITAGNTVGGMSIDVRAKHPILHNKVGGVSGPALFPIALKFVYDVYNSVKIPIIGTGGITTGEDALAMVMAGARLLGVGSAVYFRGQDVFKQITDEMEAIMKEENINSLDEIIGCAHK
jgi:dihydroorotate dehydrogenase (NAD+) catalytic subunit